MPRAVTAVFAQVDESQRVPTAAQARVGRLLRGKWRLDRLLGCGGMAAVYAATHRNSSRAAIKVLHQDLAARPDLVSRFVCEGYLANLVGHRGAVAVLDDDIDSEGTVFLVMELLRGETLEARRQRYGGALGIEDVLCILERVLDVLVSAQEHGIVHCDLKPENLFVTEAGKIKVLDFGIAGVLQSICLTPIARGTPAGTPSFMPPEQARGAWDQVDGRTDLWALGATMYTLLTGSYLRESPTHHAQLWAAATEPAPSLASQGWFPDPLVQLVDTALKTAPQERFPSAKSMQEALRQTWYHLQQNGLFNQAEQSHGASRSPLAPEPETSGVFSRDAAAPPAQNVRQTLA